MAKVLIIGYEKCVGCGTCEMVCSAKHEGVINPFQSRIKIVKWGIDGGGIPMVCAQCESAPCIDACPTNARFRDNELSRVMINDDRCIKCKTCVVVCPFGAVEFNPITRNLIGCDLCDGDPLCVKFCAFDALQYVDAGDTNRKQQRDAAEKLYESMRGFASAPATRGNKG